jgi:glyoxylase-like metal-dependent hydrolase (beta-lactamase superfamily II)
MKLRTMLYVVTIGTIMLTSSTAAAPALTLKVMTSSPEGFLVNSTLISGAKEAVLIDAQFTVADAQKVVAAIQESKKKLTTIYISHSHPDHYFGLNVLKQAFPKAKIVALPATIQRIKDTWQDKVNTWKPSYKDAIPSQPIVPTALKGNVISLEGAKLEIVEHVQGDETENSFVWIPSLKAIIAGDIVYNGVYPWTAETTPAQRKQWIASIDRLMAMTPTVVVPGHQVAGAINDITALSFMKEYLTFFDQTLSSSKSADELITKVKGKYPTLALDVILNIGADASFPKTAPTY